MWQIETNETKKPSIKSLEDRITKLEAKINKLTELQKEPPKEMKYLDVLEAGKFLGLCRAQVYKLMDKGHLPYTYVGRNRRLILADILKYCEKNYIPAKKSII